MKSLLGLSAIITAIGSACATRNCIVKTTTTTAMIYRTNGTGTMAGTGMTSVFDGTASTLDLDRTVANLSPTIVTIVDQTVHPYVTVPAGTCTIGHECTLLTSASMHGTSITESPVKSVAPFSTNVRTDNGTLYLTITSFRNTTTVVYQTQSAALPSSSSEIFSTVDSTAIISLLTQYSTVATSLFSTLTVVATPPSKIGPESATTTDAGSSSPTSPASITTVTVVPVPSAVHATPGNTISASATVQLLPPMPAPVMLTLTPDQEVTVTTSTTTTQSSTRENIYETATVTVTATTTKVSSGAGASSENWYLGLAIAFLGLAMAMICFV